MFLCKCSYLKDLRTKAARLVAGKCTLAARVDSFHESPVGTIGKCKLFIIIVYIVTSSN